MSSNPAQYPGQLYDGLTPTRPETLHRAPDAEDFDQLVSEIRATQQHLNSLLAVAGFTAPDKLGFFGVTPIARPDITGSTGANAALQDLLTKLESLGLITDSTT